MLNTDTLSRDCELIQKRSPIILNITNYVAMNLAANALLAIGASPIMSFYPTEMVDLVSLCNSVSINIGCLDKQLTEASRIAAAAALQARKAWILDPVGVGASKARNMLAADLATNYSPSIIRGNASEIIALATLLGAEKSIPTSSKGVDSSADSASAVPAAKALAAATGAIVSVSGAVDYITDGNIVETVRGGSALMPRVTAMGCTATVITAAFASVNNDKLSAATNAMRLMSICGETAESECRGTGSFQTCFLDSLSNFGQEAVKTPGTP